MATTSELLRAESDDRAARAARMVDFRRPSKFGREHVRSLEVAHEVFARRFASALGGALRALVQMEPISIDQVSYDDYTRSMPNPNLVGVMTLPSLPGAVVVDMNVQLALQLVDRMLGGPGEANGLRRPTEIEKHLLRDLAQHAVGAIGETLEPLLHEQPELAAVEYNPQLVQIAAPSDMVLLLSYRLMVTHAGGQCEGLVTLCYPSSTLTPLLGRLEVQTAGGAGSVDAEDSDPEARRLVQEHLRDVPVTLAIRLCESSVNATDIATLQVGDVLRLEHRIGQPVRGCVADGDVLHGHLGRRGRRLAFQVSEWIPEVPPQEPELAPQQGEELA